MKNNWIILLIFFWSACGTVKKPYYSSKAQNWNSQKFSSGKEKVHSLYLLGDAGELDDEVRHKNFVLDAAGHMISNETVETTIAYLGDNIYPAGLPEEDHPDRVLAEHILNAQLDLAKLHEGKTYFIPGNHDWNEYAIGGRKAVLRQERYVEQYLKDDRVKFVPSGACADPKVVKINKDLVFVFIDTQWWLQDWDKEKDINKGCDIKSRADLLQTLEETFLDHKNDEIIVLMHHPIYSDGKHGGNFSIKDHIFPLTELKPNLWIPLPVLGSIYPIFRKVSGSVQDIAHVDNKEVMQGILSVAKKTRVSVVFASGHEHGLQFFEEGKIKHIISGSAAKNDFVKRGGDASFARDDRGFVKLDFYEDFETWVSFYTVGGFGEAPQLEYRSQIRAPRPGTMDEENEYPPISQDSITIAANEEFAAGALKKTFFGKEYRDMWATPVKAEVIDLESKLDGLTPIKKGGGMASNSLRMERDGGHQYILRSIKKDYTKLVPDQFKNLKLLDVIKDQNSASHPYNALVIPTLSEAAEVFYTDPKLVYLKHQKGLGNYNSLFPEELYLLEERPSGDWGDNPNFGNSTDIIGYVDLLEILRVKKRHVVDQQWVLKSRMFDLFIHDWDRHDDQWRWAKFEEDGIKIYRPIPRDRDQAFYKFDGIIPWYISTFLMKQFKTMKSDVKDVKHLAFNARHFDRYFLNELEWSDWYDVITQLQENLTDEVIEKSMMGLPTEVMKFDFDEKLVELLKSRRDNLLKIGERHFNYLNKEIEVHGSDRRDHFEIIKRPDGLVHLIVHVHYDDEELVKYDRVIDPSITKELRLYGLRGRDEFEIKGSDHDNIRIRIIGGENKDEVVNRTKASKIFLYDGIGGAEVVGRVKDMTSDDLGTNEYNRESHRYDTSVPSFTFGNTVDDGLWLGGSMSWIKHGWRRDPYKSKQMLSASVAITSGNGLQLNYSGHFPRAIGRLDFYPEAHFNLPHYENYFGLGNDSQNPLVNREFHWVRQRDFSFNPRIGYSSRNNATNFHFGPLYQNRKVENTIGRVSNDEVLGFSDDAFETRNFFGGNVDFSFGLKDNARIPSNGIMINASASYLSELSLNEDIMTVDVNGQFYLRLLSRPHLVLANQVGYEHVSGDLQFYHYADLGNNRGLRGFRNERFRGNSAFYHNIDLRMKLFYWRNNVLPMDVGLLGGYDYGWVTLDNVTSDQSHSSQTIGLWFDILGSFVLQTYYSFNDDQNMFSLQAGFSF